MTTRYVALLRGINVGGKNRILMADLVACFEKHGFEDVATYIQSGNVLFRSNLTRTEATRQIEAMLSETFGYTATVEVRSHQQLRKIVHTAPAGFGTEPDIYRYDVIFLMPPLTSATALERLEVKDGVDELHPGPGVVYHSRLTERASQSRLTRLVSTPMYQRVTIRNWNTTTRLLAMMDTAD